ncbi:Kelch repeat-containing protein [Kordia jejudonensis]|uniref:Kelch repeat-containing protein n=1 Tax=Kordia jejudonensis TaxID=1348245 RepID=UPI000629B2BD|nr:kelch repeat-containing protein [Kordia jejudonensis]
MINRNKIQIALLIALGLFTSCSNDDDDTSRGNWIERSVFDGTPRSNAVSFIINDFGYMGTGYDGDDYLSDFWQYDMSGDFWVQKATFPGVARSSASGISIGNKGYIGLGYDGDNELNDFWEYDVVSNVWTQKADFTGTARYEAVSFSGTDFGYIGTGFDGDNDKKDFWRYNPQTNDWTELVGFGGQKRRGGVTFKIDNKVYLGTGESNGLFVDDFWEFDLSNEQWTKLRDLDDDDDYRVMRSFGTGFSINGLGYIATGYNTGAVGTVWEYSPGTDTWEEVTGLEATIRQDAISFSNGTRGLVLLGRAGNLYLDDNYELFPQELYNEDD